MGVRGMNRVDRAEFSEGEGMSEWQECLLGEVITLQRGFDITQNQQQAGDYPVVSSSGIKSYHNEWKVEGPGVVIGRKGTLGTVFYIKSDFWAHDTTLWVKDFHSNDPLFVYYFLKEFDLGRYDVGSSNPTLNRNHVHLLPALLPPLPEQKSIAQVLSSLDDKIDLLHRQNKTLEAIAETLFRQWFIEEAQEDWKEVELGCVVETTSGGTPSRSKMEYYEHGTINWVKSKELSGTFILDTEEMITEEALKNSSAKLLPTNSILIAMYGATVGAYAIISKGMTCNQAVCALKPNTKYPYTFLFLLIKNNKEKLINMAVGSAQQNISQLLIKKLLVPDCCEHIAYFDTVADPFFRKIRLNITQIRTLEKLRDTLLPKLMSGEVRVKV